MGGIVGLGHWDGMRVAQPALRRMLAPLRTGADEVTQVDHCASFGVAVCETGRHARPWTSIASDHTYHVTLCGRLSNLAELRAELCRQGDEVPNAPAELLLQLFLKHGDDAWKKLQGAWSAMVWNDQQRRLRLACDQLGRHRLFWTKQTGRVCVSSQLKGLMTQPEYQRELDAHALRQWLTLGCTLGSRTMLAGVQQTPAGCLVTIEQDRCDVESFADNHAPRPDDIRSLDEAGEYLTFALRQGLSLACDANNMVAVASSAEGPLGLVAELAAQWLTRPRQLSLGAETPALNALQTTAAWHGEMPVASRVWCDRLNEAQLAAAAGFDGLLADLGCEELLGDAEIYRRARWRRFAARHPEWDLNLPAADRHVRVRAHGTLGVLAEDPFAHPVDDASPLASHLPGWSVAASIEAYCTPALQAEWNDCDVLASVSTECPAGFAEWPWHARAEWLEVHFGLTGERLATARMAQAATSVELCSPFVEQPVIDLARRLPWRYKLCGLEPMVALRRVARWMALDARCLGASPSCGAASAFCGGLSNGNNEPLLDELMSRERLHEDGLFRPEAVTQLHHRLQRAETASQADRRAWQSILAVQLFYEQFVRNFETWCDRAEEMPACSAQPDSAMR